MKKIYSATIIASALLFGSGCGPVDSVLSGSDGADGGEGGEDIGVAEEALYVKTGNIWDTLFISVCWENAASATTEKGWVRDAVKTTWEAASAVRFQGWGTCSSGTPGIHIQVSDEQPHTTGLGDSLDGDSGGMVLNFTFAKWDTDCMTQREHCIRTIAVHEFGHALGFAHEQNRPDTPGWCDQDQGSDGDYTVGTWDLDSVMNYCNPNWNNGGVLSTTDKEGLMRFYSGWAVSYSGTSGWKTLNSSEYTLPSLRFGDFNGDGKTDVFRTNGSSWYVSYSGTSSWTYLNASSYSFSSLGFADFNGDGKTDVFVGSGSKWYVSYSGATTWTQINSSSVTVSSLAFADFNGDGKDDVFYADGSHWYVSYGGKSGWTSINSSGYTTSQLRLADFNGDGKADVFRASGTNWYVSYGGTGAWTNINASGYTVADLRFGDFNGDGKADVFRASGSAFYVSYGGKGTWTKLNTASSTTSQVALGDFNGDGKADVMKTWH